MGALNEKIKELRMKKGFAAARDFARFAGIPISSYYSYEKDTEPGSGVLATIAKALGVSIDELSGRASSTDTETKYSYYKKLIEDNTDFCVVKIIIFGKVEAIAVIEKKYKEIATSKGERTFSDWLTFPNEEDFCNTMDEAIKENIRLRLTEILIGLRLSGKHGGGFFFIFDDDKKEKGKST